jgi:anti-sigma regulatory factor (Ser/Thr protein kinase)
MAEDTGLLLELQLPCDERAPATVREALAGISAGEPAFGDAMLVASELVTNAVRYSGCADDRLQVLAAREGEHLVISVTDPGASGDTARSRGPADTGFEGLGLLIVEQLATEWGEERGDGYRVWARLALE